MKIAIVAPRAASGILGGAERAWTGLAAAIERLTAHQAEVVTLTVEEHDLVGLIGGYQRFAALDVSAFDLVVSSKYPAWLIEHPNHVLHLFHPLRGLYDTYHLTGLPLEFPGRPRSRAVGRLLQAIRRPPERAALPELFERFDHAVAEVGPVHGDLAFPGPVARELVHHLDAVALAPGAVRRHLALSRTLAGRAGYFPVGVVPEVVRLPSDLPVAGPPVPPADRNGFFTASRLEGPKRLDLLVRAMAHVTADVELAIAGRGPEQPRLAEAAAGDRRIRLLGSIGDDELARRYGTALAVPFVPVDEDYGLITVEALSAGTPVLTTTDAGGPTELVINGVNGLVVASEPAAIGRALDHLAGDRSWAGHLGRAGRRQAAEITWEAAVAAILGEPPAATVSDSGRAGQPRRRRYVVPSTYGIHPARGGGQLRYRHLYGELARHADVHVVSLVNPPRPTSTTVLAPGLSETVVGVSDAQLAEDVALSRATGVPTTDIVAGRSISATPEYIDVLRQALDGADGVILAHPFLLPALEAAGSTVPFVYDAHNAEAELKGKVLGGTVRGRELAAWVTEVEGRTVRQAEHVVACSIEDVATLRRWFGRDPSGFVVIPNGTDADRAVPTPAQRRERGQAWLAAWNAARRGPAERDQQPQPHNDAQPPGGAAGARRFHGEARPGEPQGGERDQQEPPATALATFFASWHPPNLDAAEVLIDLAGELPEVVFVLAGSHSDHFRTRSLPQNVALAGVVSDDAKATLLAAADVALNPMRQGSGTNLKVVEYFASGVPAVSTPFGVRGLDVDDRHLFLAGIEGFADAIRGVLADPAAAADRAAAARALVIERYDWAALGDRLAVLMASAF